MKIACHKSSDKACRVCGYRYVCDMSAYHKHDDVPARKPLQVDVALNATSNNPVSNRAVALAIEALRLTIGRWGNIGGNVDDQKDLSARFGSIEELIGLLSERIKAVEESIEGTEEVATDDYQQVTQCQEDWSGEYVIICTKDGSTHLFAGTDVDANYIDVSVSDGTVTVPYDDLVAEACMVKIERFGDNYSLRVVGGANDGKYMYNNSNTNNIKFNDEPQEVVIEWDDENGVRIHSVGYNTILQMYINSANTRFRFYKTAQNPIVLCKRVYTSADTADIGKATVRGNLDVYKDAQVYGDMQVSGKATIDNGLKVGGDIVFGDESTPLSDELKSLSQRIDNLQGGTGGVPAEPVRTTLQELYQNAAYEEYEDPDDFYIHVNECIAAGDTDHLFKHLGNFYVIIEDKLVCVGTENAFNTADLNFILGTMQEQVDVLNGEVETRMPFEHRSGESIMDILNRGGALSLNEVALIAIAALFNSRYAAQYTGANIVL